MKAMKKILALALAGVMALALLTGCGTGGSASHKSIAKAMADHDRGIDNNLNITCTSSAELDALLQTWAANPGFKTAVKAFYENGTHPTIPSGSVLSGKVVYIYCGKYDKDAGKQALNLNVHSDCISTSNPNLADERQIGLITTSFTDTNGKEVKVRFAVVVSEIPAATP
jgi:hypothetical protein